MKRHFPNALQAILLFLLLEILTSIGIAGYSLFHHRLEPDTTLKAIDSFAFYSIKIIAVLIVYFIGSRRIKHYEKFSLQHELNIRFNTNYIYAIAGIIALIFLMEPLEKLFPATPLLQVYFSSLSELKFISLFYIVILSPIVNELLFRAVILRGLIKSHNPGLAILLSSILFALFHFSFLQMAISFFLSLFIGFIYWQTRSVFLCIILHIINNGVAYFIILTVGEISSFERMISNTPLYLVLYLLAAMLFSTSLLQIYKRNELKL